MFDYKTTMKYIITRAMEAECVVIFGAFETGIFLCDVLNRENILVNCFCDNNESLQGSIMSNVEVISPRQAIEVYPDALYIIASSRCRDEIKNQLISLKINEDRIICYYELQSSYDFYKNLEEKNYEDVVQDLYYRTFGRYLNLHPPKTYNEKIVWRKLYDHNKLKTRLTDKYLVRGWVEQEIGGQYLNDLIGYWKSADEIDFHILPDQFVLKLNHGCGWNIIVRDKKVINEKDIRRQLEEWKNLNFAYHSLERQYKDITPLILCEKYLENSENDLYDYKVFCFHGKPKYIMFLTERNRGGIKMAFYDTKWVRQPFVYSYPMIEKEVPKPLCLDRLLTLSSKLAKSFDHVRIDWYILPDNELRFGEMTFTPAAGYAAWNPPEYDKILGELF